MHNLRAYQSTGTNLAPDIFSLETESTFSNCMFDFFGSHADTQFCLAPEHLNSAD